MKKLHALGAGVLGVALSATSALAVAPRIAPGLAAEGLIPPTNHGAVVSAVAGDDSLVGGKNDNHGGAVSTVARGTHGPSAQDDAAPTVTAPASTSHGAAVSTVAKDKTQVGGKNDNHGGAVSAVARGSHGSGH